MDIVHKVHCRSILINTSDLMPVECAMIQHRFQLAFCLICVLFCSFPSFFFEASIDLAGRWKLYWQLRRSEKIYFMFLALIALWR